ncbi:MAG: phosphohydrolase [Rhodoferax sp.]|nr:phosphohydrolase [Rhodoferax sp.]
MNLFTIDPRSIPLGEPLNFSIRSGDGVLLARRGHMFFHRTALSTLAAHGDLYVDMQEAQAYYAALKRQPASRDSAGNANKSGRVSAKGMPLAGKSKSGAADADSVHLDWLDLQSRVDTLLRSPQSVDFLKRILQVQEELAELVRRSPDATLLALTHLAAEENQLYSATHSLFVCAICALAAHEVLKWPHELQQSMMLAALTMNISITDLQDRLATQEFPLSDAQQIAVKSHAQHSADLLKAAGVLDPVWLGAIACHHRQEAGQLSGRAPIDQVARLIHRADIFAARLSPRVSRAPLPSLAAMKAAYLDEDSKVDEAGAALIRVLGIHHPGALVKLATDEIAIVIRRGMHRLHPTVAVLVGKNGMPLVEPVIRDTRQPEFAIVANVKHTDIKARTDLLRLLAVV